MRREGHHATHVAAQEGPVAGVPMGDEALEGRLHATEEVDGALIGRLACTGIEQRGRDSGHGCGQQGESNHGREESAPASPRSAAA